MHTPTRQGRRQAALAWLRTRLWRQRHAAALAVLPIAPAVIAPEAIAPAPAAEPPDADIDIAGWPALVAPFYD